MVAVNHLNQPYRASEVCYVSASKGTIVSN